MLIRNLKVSRLLSFGPEGIDLAMHPLNVLIGANGCGKSNFVEVLNLLKYTPVRFDSPIMMGGGINDFQEGRQSPVDFGGSGRAGPSLK